MSNFFEKLEAQLHAAARAQIAVNHATHRPPRSWLRTAARRARHVPAAVAPTISIVVALAIALAAVLLLRPAHHHPAPTNAGASERQLLAQYAILRRPQTQADLAEAGPAPSVNRETRFSGSGGRGPGRGTFHYTVRLTGLPRYHDIPGLTRVVHVGGVTVSLFVEDLLPSHQLPKAIVTGNDPKAAARAVTRQQLELRLRAANERAGYSLWARVGRSGLAQLIAPGPSYGHARGGRLGVPTAALWEVATASLPGPGGRIVAIVPDTVARVSWTWPREFVSQALSYKPSVTIAATAVNNVAVAMAPARFSSVEQVDPETVVRYDQSGRVIAHATDPSNSASVYLETTWDATTPGPETPRSRRAERDPSTPNPVVTGSARQFFFHVLLNNRTYFLRVTGGPHSGCVKTNPQDPSGPGYGAALHPGAEPTARGDTYLGGSPPGIISCPGIYRLSISVLNAHSQPYRPFGSATFVVR